MRTGNCCANKSPQNSASDGASFSEFIQRNGFTKHIESALTLEVSGRCHSECQITVACRSGPLDRIVMPHERMPTQMTASVDADTIGVSTFNQNLLPMT